MAKDRRHAFLIAGLYLGLTGCVPAAVKSAVKAYAIAADQVAESGQADVTQCQNQQDPQQKEQFCEKARKQFQTIRESAAQLKNVD